MKLEPLYRLTFSYPESWDAGPDRYLIAEGRCEGRVAGRFRGSNRARRRPKSGGWLPHLDGAIETDDGASILLMLTGQADPRADPNGRIVASIVHTAERNYAWLNSTLGVVCGEVRGGREIVLDVAELVWEPLQA
jgi:hypothetical protein